MAVSERVHACVPPESWVAGFGKVLSVCMPAFIQKLRGWVWQGPSVAAANLWRSLLTVSPLRQRALGLILQTPGFLMY